MSTLKLCDPKLSYDIHRLYRDYTLIQCILDETDLGIILLYTVKWSSFSRVLLQPVGGDNYISVNVFS